MNKEIDLNNLKEVVESLVSEKRYAHILRVAEMAERLADYWKLDQKKAEIAAIGHDIAKQLTPDQLAILGVPLERCHVSLYETHPPVWHAFVGADLIKVKCGYWDNDVTSAIMWHTTGSDNMTPLDKLIYVADFIETGRHHPFRLYLETLAFSSLDEACFGTAWCSIFSLLNKGAIIHPSTFACYNQQHHHLGKIKASAISEGLREIYSQH